MVLEMKKFENQRHCNCIADIVLTPIMRVIKPVPETAPNMIKLEGLDAIPLVQDPNPPWEREKSKVFWVK